MKWKDVFVVFKSTLESSLVYIMSTWAFLSDFLKHLNPPPPTPKSVIPYRSIFSLLFPPLNF